MGFIRNVMLFLKKAVTGENYILICKFQEKHNWRLKPIHADTFPESMWVLEPVKPETSLAAKMTTQKLSYSGPIRRQGPLEKTRMLGKTEGSRKGGSPNVRWTDPTKEAAG